MSTQDWLAILLAAWVGAIVFGWTYVIGTIWVGKA
jgi:hypothetical protein